MKTTFILSLSIFALAFTACNNPSGKTESASSTDSTAAPAASNTQTFNLDTAQLASGASYYQCEMHAQVVSDKPGSCPECGMDLTAITKK